LQRRLCAPGCARRIRSIRRSAGCCCMCMRTCAALQGAVRMRNESGGPRARSGEQTRQGSLGVDAISLAGGLQRSCAPCARCSGAAYLRWRACCARMRARARRPRAPPRSQACRCSSGGASARTRRARHAGPLRLVTLHGSMAALHAVDPRFDYSNLGVSHRQLQPDKHGRC